MKVAVVEGDLLHQKADVIVNAWNRNFIPWWLLLPQGASGAIKKEAGYAPFQELRKEGLMPLGGAVLTTAGRLPYKGIIHVAGLHAYWVSSEKSIRLSVDNAIELAKEHGFGSIAFPLIGAGTGGQKQETVLAIMRDELSKLDYDGEVTIVRYKKIETSPPVKPGKKSWSDEPVVNPGSEVTVVDTTIADKIRNRPPGTGKDR